MGKKTDNTGMTDSGVKLQVLICTYGRSGLSRVAEASHPEIPGVEYLVCIQDDGSVTDHDAPKALMRNDIKFIVSSSIGLSVNRNIAIYHASAPLLLISDDDVDYTEEGLKAVMDGFDNNPEADILTFKYASPSSRKYYPSVSFPLGRPPKGYFASSIEIAMRRESVQGKVWFNENFGVRAIFPSGEEEIFLRDCLDKGLNGIFIPTTIATHTGLTTSERNLMYASRPQTKGAVFLHLHPLDWPLRMVMHAIREIPLWRKGLVPSPLSYCSNWIKGVRMARKAKVFPTKDFPSKHSYHE